MKAGTHVRTPDGREWTVVYHGPDGYGVVEGRRTLTEDELRNIHLGGPFSREALAEAVKATHMLRDSVSPTMDERMWPGMTLIGEEFERIAE